MRVGGEGSKEVKEIARIWRVVWSVRSALLPVCFTESPAKTGRSAQLPGEEVKGFKEVAGFL